MAPLTVAMSLDWCSSSPWEVSRCACVRTPCDFSATVPPCSSLCFMSEEVLFCSKLRSPCCTLTLLSASDSACVDVLLLMTPSAPETETVVVCIDVFLFWENTEDDDDAEAGEVAAATAALRGICAMAPPSCCCSAADALPSLELATVAAAEGDMP